MCYCTACVLLEIFLIICTPFSFGIGWKYFHFDNVCILSLLCKPYLPLHFEWFHNSVIFICTTWYEQSGLSSTSIMNMSSWLLFFFGSILPTTSHNCRLLLITDLGKYISIFSFLLTFTFRAFYFLFSYSFTSFSSFQSPEISSCPILNLPLTNDVKISDNEDIQSVHPSLSENVGKEVSIITVDLCQYN